MSPKFSTGDLCAVAAAAALSTGLIVWVNTSGVDVVVKDVPVTIAPRSCVKALDAVDDTVTATGELIDTANRIAPLMQDVYDAGAAGADIAPRVQEWNRDLKAAHAAAENTPDRFDLLAQKCRAERTLP